MQVRWDVGVHGRDLYLIKANLASPARYKHLNRPEVIMTRLCIPTLQSHQGPYCLSWTPSSLPPLWQHTIKRTLWWVLRSRCPASLFECVPPFAIIEYLKEAGFFHLIWGVFESEITNVKSQKPHNPDYYMIEYAKRIAENTRKMCRMANMSWRTCVVVKQTPFHSIPLQYQTPALWRESGCTGSSITTLSIAPDTCSMTVQSGCTESLITPLYVAPDTCSVTWQWACTVSSFPSPP